MDDGERRRKEEALARAEETAKRLENEIQFKDLANARLTETARTNLAEITRLGVAMG